MPTYRYLTDMPPRMSWALQRIHTTVVLVDGGPARHKIRPATMAALRRHGLVEEGRDKRSRPAWKPSAAGLGILTADAPRLLRPRSGYTTNPALAMFPDAGEAVDERTLTRFTTEAHSRHRATRATSDCAMFEQQRSLEQRLVTLRTLAWSRGIDARSELRLVERGLNGIERKIRDQRKAA